jgi:hypothetical protein
MLAHLILLDFIILIIYSEVKPSIMLLPKYHSLPYLWPVFPYFHIFLVCVCVYDR